MAISWREELSIGVEEIDSQHKELLARFDMLLGACRQGKGNEEVKHLLEFLDDYVNSHFSDEEKLQQKSGFPGYEQHHREHESFIGRLAELKDRMRTDGDVRLDHVLDTNKMLMDWLIRHISVKDREVGRHIRNSGINLQ